MDETVAVGRTIGGTSRRRRRRLLEPLLLVRPEEEPRRATIRERTASERKANGTPRTTKNAP